MLTIHEETVVRAPAERCFDLTRSVDVHVDSATGIGARAVDGRRQGLAEEGDATVWSARFFGLRFAMRTQIEHLISPARFDDRLTRGLLREFAHTYRFRSLPDGGCVVSDELRVEAPFGVLGRWIERIYLSRRMRGLVRRRLEYIRRVAEGDEWRRYLFR